MPNHWPKFNFVASIYGEEARLKNCFGAQSVRSIWWCCSCWSCCCFALSQSEFMWHKEVRKRTFFPPLPSVSAFSLRMSLDCIEKWMKLECLMAFWIGFRRLFLSPSPFRSHSPFASVSLSLFVFIYLALCLLLLVALFAGQFQATPQDRPQNGALASCPATVPFSIAIPLSISPALHCPIAFDCCCMSKWKYLLVTTLKTWKS